MKLLKLALSLLILSIVLSAQSLTNPPLIQIGTVAPVAAQCTNSAVGNIYIYNQTTSMAVYHCAPLPPGTAGYAWSLDVTSPSTTNASLTGVTLTAPNLAQNTTSTPFTSFSTLSTPGNLIAPGAVTDTVAEYWSQIFIPTSTTLTGACLLNGATVTTDKHILFLANAAGTIIANSALAGVSDSGASRYQCQAFVTPVAVVGPQTYFVGTQPNGTTDTFLAYATGGAPTNYGTGLTTAAVFGTLVNITPTNVFTTAEGPLMLLY